jgi:hypothetical protein
MVHTCEEGFPQNREYLDKRELGQLAELTGPNLFHNELETKVLEFPRTAILMNETGRWVLESRSSRSCPPTLMLVEHHY